MGEATAATEANEWHDDEGGIIHQRDQGMLSVPRVVLCAVLVGYAAAGLMDTAENITILTIDNFDEYLDQHPLVLVEFMMPVHDGHVALHRSACLFG
jgi:hypothetical protein